MQAAAPPDLSLAAVRKLTNLTDINRLLNEALAWEHTIDAELEQLLAKKDAIEKSLLGLESDTAEMLEIVRVDADVLAGSINGTAELSENVSRKVRELDTAQSRIQDTLARINLVVDRTACLEGVRTALEGGQYEEAARCCATFRDLEARFAPAADDLDSAQAQQQRAVMAEAQEQLEGVVRSQLRAAAARADHAAVLRFVQLWVPLGRAAEGVSWFTSYLCDLITQRAKEAYEALVDTSAKRPDYVGALSSLFRDIAVALDENEAFLRDTFGGEAMLEVMQGLQTACDTEGQRLLKRYVAFRKLPALAKQLASLKRAAADGTSGTVDPRQVEGFLEEMLALAGRAEEYNQFMLARMAAAAAPAALGASRENAFRSGAFNVAVRELIAYYISLEEFYLEENLDKALAIDELVAGGLTSSCVDDTFFILQKCGRRAIATGSLQCACAVLGQINSLLSTAFRASLDARLQGAATRLLQAALPPADGSIAAPPDQQSLAQAATPFNNAEVSATYVQKLRGNLEERAGEVFPAAGDRERLRSMLADLAKTAGDFGALASRGLEALAAGLMPRLRPALEEAASCSYQMSEGEYAAAEAGDSWVARLLVALEGLLSALQPLLTPGCHDTLVHLLADKVVARLEAVVLAKRYNALGGLALERAARQLTAGLSELAARPLRDKLARVSQVAVLVALEAPGEVADLWAAQAGGASWRLTPADVRQVLALRADFAADDIAALVL